MSNVTACYGTLLDFIDFLGIFIIDNHSFQTFTDYMSNQYAHFDRLICQMLWKILWFFMGPLEISMFDTLYFIKLS